MSGFELAVQQRELVAAWGRAERAEKAVLQLQKEVTTLRAELERCRRKQSNPSRDETVRDRGIDQLLESVRLSGTTMTTMRKPRKR